MACEECRAYKEECARVHGHLSKIEASIGLHESVYIIYTVDGYLATLEVNDGNQDGPSGYGPHLHDALESLALRLQDRTANE